MLTIFHNPKCSKSREGICFLDELKQPYQVVKYLETEITFNDLSDIIKKLNIKPIELVRTKEKIWIENYKGKELNDNEIIEIMIKNPKLIERPIIINENKAVIARPTERINEIL